MSTADTVLRRWNGYHEGVSFRILPKPVTCPKCSEIHGNRLTKNFTSTTGFFVHYTGQHTISAKQKDYLKRQIMLFQQSDFTLFHEFLNRGRIE